MKLPGGYGRKAPVKLADALETMWDRLGVPATGADRTRRKRRKGQDNYPRLS